ISGAARCVEVTTFALPDLFGPLVVSTGGRSGCGGGEQVLGVDPVAGGGGEAHRGFGGRPGGPRGYDQQVHAVAVVAACGQQPGGLAGEVAQPYPAARDCQPAWSGVPAVGGEDQPGDRSMNL